MLAGVWAATGRVRSAGHRLPGREAGCMLSCERGRADPRGRVAAHCEPDRLEGVPIMVEVEAEIAGSVFKLEKSVGDSVAEEDVLLILESMKMEIPVESPCTGRVAEVRVAEGDSIDEGDVLVVLEE